MREHPRGLGYSASAKFLLNAIIGAGCPVGGPNSV
jgi:hypothetical protein